jgi:glycosyltransferase involved in cell wall biosynthesis
VELETNARKTKDKRVVFFRGELLTPGGAERVLVEEAKYFERQGISTYILTSDFDKKALFNEQYKASIEIIGRNIYSASILKRILSFPKTVLSIRKKLNLIKPDIIVAQTYFDCIYLYFATFFTAFPYATHVHDTISWIVGSAQQQALIYRKGFNEVKNSLPGHREFIPKTPPKMNLIKRITGELASLAEYFATRKAKVIFVLTNHVKWEVAKLYGKEAVVVRGGFNSKILEYKPGQNIKEKLGLSGKQIILNINRLMPTKRVDLLIKAFQQISSKVDNAVLVIGGTGPEETNLKILASRLGVENKVIFAGFIKEEELWDYYYGCDIFVHPDWLTSAIAPFEALAAGKKIVLSTDMEIPEVLQNDPHIFLTSPTVDDLAKTIGLALKTRVIEKIDLYEYTWESYCGKIFAELSPWLS